jgi:hypothetical protein
MSQGSTIASKGGIVSGPNTNKIGCNSNSTEMWTILTHAPNGGINSIESAGRGEGCDATPRTH